MNPKTRPPLTDPQSHVLAYMVKFLELNDQLPTMAKIAADFGWSSPNAADTHVRCLEKKGYLARNELGNYMLADRPQTPIDLASSVLTLVDSRAAGWDSATRARDDAEGLMQIAAKNEARVIAQRIRELLSKEVAHG